jgi:hypothetical protein
VLEHLIHLWCVSAANLFYPDKFISYCSLTADQSREVICVPASREGDGAEPCAQAGAVAVYAQCQGQSRACRAGWRGVKAQG